MHRSRCACVGLRGCKLSSEFGKRMERERQAWLLSDLVEKVRERPQRGEDPTRALNP